MTGVTSAYSCEIFYNLKFGVLKKRLLSLVALPINKINSLAFLKNVTTEFIGITYSTIKYLIKLSNKEFDPHNQKVLETGIKIVAMVIT